jgi:7-carboxy-7-deazaguanine synthase
MLFLVEHFYSIQGEGRYTGTPSLFFRFGGCNMRCEGFGCEAVAPDGTTISGCDTLYAVDKAFSAQWVGMTRLEQFLHVMELYELPDNVDIVFTGGEPLLFYEDTVLLNFLSFLQQEGHRITFETNGTILIDFEKYPLYKNCIFALSVKLSNAKEPFNRRVKPQALIAYAQNAKETFFKFAVDADSITAGLDEEIEEVSDFASSLQVYCMPLGENKKLIETNSLPLIEFCKAKGYTYSDRLHIRIWDQTHGV